MYNSFVNLFHDQEIKKKRLPLLPVIHGHDIIDKTPRTKVIYAIPISAWGLSNLVIIKTYKDMILYDSDFIGKYTSVMHRYGCCFAY